MLCGMDSTGYLIMDYYLGLSTLCVARLSCQMQGCRPLSPHTGMIWAGDVYGMAQFGVAWMPILLLVRVTYMVYTKHTPQCHLALQDLSPRHLEAQP